MKKKYLLVVLSGIVLLFAGCSPKVEEKKESASAELKPEAAHGASTAATPEKSTGLKFTAPTEWIVETPSSSSRQSQYKLPRIQGDSEDAQLIIYYFGGGGGAPQANIDRWIGEFSGPNGKPVTDAKILHKTVNGLVVTTVDVKGTYASSMGMMMKSGSSAKTGERLLGAIAETASGPWFIKLTGPERTVAKWQPSFEAFLNSMRQSE